MKSLYSDNSNPQSSWSKTYKSTSSNGGHHHFAVVRTTKGKPRRYNGAYMNSNAFNPSVGPMQFSSTRMHFQIGNEFIHVGWTAGGHECYNLLCLDGSGMILVSQDLIPGRLTEHMDLNFAIIKDKDNGNWWLLMGTGYLWEHIGFWPARRFKESFGNRIEWGGEVYSPSPPNPPMGCPIGTVPILRVTKDALLKMKSIDGYNSKPQSSWSKTYKPTSSIDNHNFAVVRTTKGKPKSYNGASMNINTFTPSVGPMQFSASRMHFQIGNEFIQVGWIVHPQLYHDFNSRLFVFTNAGGHECYNLFCPDGSGMILVSQDFTPGLLAEQKSIDFAIMKDKINGNWWLLMGTSWEEIGFWPSSRFKESSGTRVEWGGEVYSPSPPNPPMGNSHYPKGSPIVDSYVRLITTVDENYNTDKTVKNTERYSDSCYKVRDATETFWSHVGHLIIYGGPGCK
ncbi:Neprosin [Arabidopsis suecica]|uniref:Neprosin n=1 Tax=Arabidopsis suecica TaxID=45249 RepID=A0A8T1YKD4_ARASU|nr:Neprosin [Arabidopsis suecica]